MGPRQLRGRQGLRGTHALEGPQGHGEDEEAQPVLQGRPVLNSIQPFVLPSHKAARKHIIYIYIY